jgi:CDP-diacylglycerol--glycerol-3-phosphate 3-phosphatidyltransferase
LEADVSVSLSLWSLLAVLGLLFASMGLFVLRGGRRDADAVSKNAQFAGGLGDFLLHWFLWLVDPAARLSVRMGLTPDFYNFAGLAWGAISGLALALDWIEIAGWALVFSGVCDILDGRIARATHVTSRYGAFVDSLLDRFIELFFFVGFAYAARHSAHGALAATLGLGASILVSYARAMGETQGVECTGGLMQRGERLALLALACLADRVLCNALRWPHGTLLLGVVYLIGIMSFATAVHRTVWIAQRLRGTESS